MAKQVADVMTPAVAAIEPSRTVAEAAQAMRSEDVGSLPVTDAAHENPEGSSSS